MSDPAVSTFSRRRFINASGGAILAPAIITAATTLRAQQKVDSNETLKVGLIGCGGRGTGAAAQALTADYNTKLVALADAFDTQIEGSIKSLSQQFPDRVDVKPEMRFTGLDAYKKLLATNVDVVLLATPPGFRPQHLTAAVESGKHIFCEKPMAVDAAGYHVAMAAVRKAAEKKINLVAGFCWRYSASRIEAYKRVHGGDIGDVTSIFASYYAGPVKPMPPASGRPADMGDVEWQIRNWYNFSWLSGDSIVEQAVHSIDKIVWAMKDTPPLSCVATGGRQIPAEGGNIFDHFHVAYEWEGGILCHLGSRQQRGTHAEVIDVVHGTKGKLVLGKGPYPFIEGEKRWRHREGERQMHQAEHDALFAAIRKGEIINNGDRMMLSSLVGVMGREAAYTGQKIAWKDDSAPPAPAAEENKGKSKETKGKEAKDKTPERVALAMMSSKQDLAPDSLKFGDKFDPGPMPLPGVTKFA
ncbi:MAG: Gfo/Idh/MocA family oxidoreductase [Verrucomicrobiaceae bacterium]